MQHRRSGGSATCRTCPKSLQLPLEASPSTSTCIADQFLAKADVIRAMRERVQLCQDPQTEVALLRESLGVSSINHILRVHGHTIPQEQRAAEIDHEVGQRSPKRLFPGLTEDSVTQTTLGSKQLEDCRDQTSHTRPSHPSNIPAPHLKMTATTVPSQRPGRTDSVPGSSKFSFHGSPIGLVPGA